MRGNRVHPSLDDVKQRVIAAICMLYRHDRELLDVDANERSVTHKLAEYLQREFPNWNVDCEYNRRGHATKRLPLSFGQTDTGATEAVTVFPDIIIHRRTTDENLLVIEVKKASGLTDTRDDEKLRAFTQVPEYRYEYGLFLKLGANDSAEVKLYQRGCCAVAWSDDVQRALRELGYGG